MGRKALIEDEKLGLETAEDVLQYQRAVKKEWRNLPETQDKIFVYNRRKTLSRCFNRASVPTVNCIRKYGFTREELEPIFEQALLKALSEASINEKIAEQEAPKIVLLNRKVIEENDMD